MAAQRRMSRGNRQRVSIIESEGNPFNSGGGEAVHVKIENITDCVLIGDDEFQSMIELLNEIEENDAKLRMLDLAKKPHLFNSSQLLKLLNSITSVKTRLSMIDAIGPRLVDPRAKSEEIVGLFRYAEERSKAEEVLKARTSSLNAAMFKQTGGGAEGGRGGVGRGGGAGRGGGGRGLSLVKKKSVDESEIPSSRQRPVLGERPKSVATSTVVDPVVSPASEGDLSSRNSVADPPLPTPPKKIFQLVAPRDKKADPSTAISPAAVPAPTPPPAQAPAPTAAPPKALLGKPQTTTTPQTESLPTPKMDPPAVAPEVKARPISMTMAKSDKSWMRRRESMRRKSLVMAQLTGAPTPDPDTDDTPKIIATFTRDASSIGMSFAGDGDEVGDDEW